MTRITLLGTALAAAALGLAADRAEAATSVTAAVDNRILTIQGTAAAENVVLRLSTDATAVEVDDVVAGPGADLAIARSRFDRIVVRMGAGNDELRLDETRGAFTFTTPTVLSGQDGHDRIFAGLGEETIVADAGNDSVDGGPGNDVVRLGLGDDVLGWQPGDGSDVVDGQDGRDELRFTGSDLAERIDVSTGGTRARLTRDVANIVMDLGGMEEVDLSVRGGTDQLSIQGTAGDDAVDVFGAAGTAAVDGLPVSVITRDVDSGDRLALNALGGNDSIIASSLSAGVVDLKVDAGDGDDVVSGSMGADLILAGAGQDRITPDRGNDTAFMGDGGDRLAWKPGDGNDVVEGQAGFDRLVFTGSAANERVTISANGGRVLLTRDVANIVMDIEGTEQIDHNALGGADTLSVRDLSLTSLTRVTTSLAATLGSTADDFQPDHVIVDGTSGVDNIAVAGSNGAATVTGLAATVAIRGAEGSDDTLTIRTLEGADTVDSSALAAGTIGLTVQ